MVDFRYHLVSIIAVFLALAVGIVLGTTTINGPALDTLKRRLDSLSTDRDALRTENQELTDQLANEAVFAQSLLPFAVAGKLTGEDVVLISVPNAAAGTRDAVAQAMVTAGATVVGRVQLTKKFTDPAESKALEAVVQQVLGSPPAGVGTPLQHATNQLATALATPTRGGARGVNAETDRVLGLFKDADLITVEGAAAARSSAVVIVAAVPEEKDAEGKADRVRGINEMVAALSRQAAAVVAVAPTGSAIEGGVLSSLRRDDTLASDVSSVDRADTASGQIAVVYALVERLRAAAAAGERPAAGHYGTGPGADRPLPDLAAVS